MIFEKAGFDDIPALTELRIRYLLEDHGALSADKIESITDSLRAYFPSHLNRDFIAFVCRVGDVIAGCCFLCITEKPASPSFPKGRTGTVMNVYTRPEYRKKGIAGRLMKLLLAEAAEAELDFVELKATDSGYNLYKSLGFKDAASKYHNMKFEIVPDMVF